VPTAGNVTGIGFCSTRAVSTGTAPPAPRPPPLAPAGACPLGAGEDEQDASGSDIAKRAAARRVDVFITIWLS
jgi:hypothetical protein